MIDPNFYVHGIATGIYWSLAAILFFFCFFQWFINKKRHSALLFFYGSFAHLFFALFDTYALSYHVTGVNTVVPDWLFFLGKLTMPLAIGLVFSMFIQSIPIKSLPNFLFWIKAKKFYPFFYSILFIITLFNIFSDDVRIIIALSLAMSALNNLYSICISSIILKSTLFRSLIIVNALCLAILQSSSVYIVIFLQVDQLPQALLLFAHIAIAISELSFVFLLSTFIMNNSLHNEALFHYHIDGFYKQIFHAIKNDEFFIEYQPKVLLATKQVCGLEALVRWKHPIYGLVSPATFIPIAEKTDVINNICELVIDKVVKDIAILHTSGIDIPVSINFSVNNIHNKMMSYLINSTDKHGISLSSIIIEITETLFLEMTPAQKKALALIQKAGIKLSLDDFGAGYSSLKYLDEMALYEVKIDKALIDNVLDHKKQVVIANLTTMCRELHINVVAEGVNDEQTSAALVSMQCTMAQGFGICRPKSLYELVIWINEYEQQLNKRNANNNQSHANVDSDSHIDADNHKPYQSPVNP